MRTRSRHSAEHGQVMSEYTIVIGIITLAIAIAFVTLGSTANDLIAAAASLI